MRGKISDQDLTDYALNELQPEERLYVESMLAVSAECRNDVYEMIELAQMLDEGFEEEEEKAPVLLTGQQRHALLQFRARIPAWQQAAAVAALAACTAMTLTHPSFWRIENSRGKVTRVSTQMSNIVAEAVVPGNGNLANSISNWRALAEDTSSWFPAASEVWSQGPMVCTPPSVVSLGE